MSIAVAHNDTPQGHAALVTAVEWAQAQNTDLLVLHIVENDDPQPSEDAVRLARGAVTNALADAGIEAEWTLHVAAGAADPAGALVDLLIETGAETLVIGSKRRSPIGKFLLGSTVQRVVLDAPVPVLVVKAAA